MLEIRALLDELLESRKQRLRHHQAFGAAVGQHEAIVVLGEQRIDRHRDDAGLQAAEKRGRPVDGVEQRQQHALFALDAEPAQRRAETRHAIGQLAVGVRAARVDIGRLVGAAGVEYCSAARRRQNCSRAAQQPWPACRTMFPLRRSSSFQNFLSPAKAKRRPRRRRFAFCVTSGPASAPGRHRM